LIGGQMAQQRDSSGRYVKGHRGSTKSKQWQTRSEYFNAFCKAISLEDWIKATKAIMALCLEKKDYRAWKVLAAYLMGSPVMMVEADIEIKRELSERELSVLESIYGNMPVGETIEGTEATA